MDAIVYGRPKHIALPRVDLRNEGRSFPPMPKTMRLCALAFSLLLVVFSAEAAAQECFSYEANAVQLTGTISKKTFPGAPNYESIRQGDKPETYWILHLGSPICTTAGADSDAESGVSDLQLILTRKQYALYRKFVERKTRVTITGKLMHAHTGHHHTPVLMEVAGIIGNAR